MSDFEAAGGTVSLISQGSLVTIAFGLPSVTETTTYDRFFLELIFINDGGNTFSISHQVNITVNPAPSTTPSGPTFQSVTVNGTSGATVNANLDVTPTDFTINSVVGSNGTQFNTAGGTVSATNLSDPITLAFVLPIVNATTTLTETLRVAYAGDGGVETDMVNATITVNPAPPTPPTISDIAVTGTGGTSETHILQVTDIPAGYTFDSATPDSTLSTANVTASGEESGGTVTITFGLPSVGSSTEITGNLDVQYTDGTDTLDVAVPVTLTVNPPDPPTVTNITATGTENTTISETITVTNVPAGYSFTNATADATLTAAGVTISGTESNGTISVDIGLPSAQATAITGNIVVTYGDGTNTLISNSAVSLTVNPPDPPTISDITATGTGGTSETQTLQVSGIPPGYSFLSATPASNLSDDNVTASGTDSGGTVTISFGLPPVSATATITGDLSVRYSNGTTNLDVTVPVSLTVNPPAPPTVTNITATGTENTTISETITVTNVPVGYSFTNATADATLTAAGVSISGTESNGTITVSIGLPSAQATAITGNIVVSYGGLISNSAVSLTVNPPDPPTISDITATGTAGTSISHILQVSDVPDGYSFDSAAPDSTLSTANVTASGEESGGTVTISFGLPSVGSSTEITGNLDVIYSDGTDNLDVAVPVTLTVNPPDPPTVTNINATGTENTTISETITVTNVPTGYTYTSIAADSALTSAGVTISGTESGGTISVDIGLPSAQATAITGNIIVSYGDGTNTLTSNSTVSLTVEPTSTTTPSGPTFQSVTVNGTSGATVNANLGVTPTDFTIRSVTGSNGTPFITAGGTVSATNLSDPITLAFVLPTVNATTILTETLRVEYVGDGVVETDEVAATITINPAAPTPPTIQDIAATGTAGTSISHILQVTDIPTGYSFDSAAPDSTLSTANVTASGEESGGTVTITFGLPSVGSSTEITGNLDVQYIDGTDTLDVAVPVTLTVNPPDPPTVTNITATGIENTTISETITVTNVPAGYSFLSATPDSTLSTANVTASGTESNGTISVDIGLPSAQATAITGNIIVSYGDGTNTLISNSAVSLTVNAAVVDPPTIQDIAVTGTGGTSETHILQVTDIPDGYTFDSATPDSDLTDESVTASGAESGGTVTITFGLPEVRTTTTITGNLDVTYTDGTDDLDVVVPVTLTVNPVPSPAFQNITVNGTGGTTVNANLGVTPTDFTITSVFGNRESTFTTAGGSVSATNLSNPITLAFVLPTVNATTTLTDTLQISYQLNGVGFAPTVTATITVNPDSTIPTPPTIQNITVTGTGGTSETHTLQVSNVPDGYSFVSATPASNLSDDNVTASGTDSSGTVTISFGLPSVGSSTTITGDLSVRYSNGTTNLDVTVPVTLTVNPPDPPTVTNITATGTENTTISETITVTNVPAGYSFTNATADATLTSAGVTISGTESGGTISVDIGLPSAQASTITGNILVSYGDGSTTLTSNSAVSLTVNPPDPPTVTNITATGTENTTITDTITVTNIPAGYTFTSVSRDSALTSASVTISGTESNGTISVDIGLPSAQATPITGNIVVTYGDGTNTLTSNSAVSLTVEPVIIDPPIISDITATGTGGTSISHTLQVSNIPAGYTFDSAAPDSDLTDESVTASGTESSGTVTISFGLPSVGTSTTITGNLDVTYTDGTDDLDVTVPVTLTVNPVPSPVFQNITLNGTSGATVNANIPVTPTDFTVTSVSGSSQTTFTLAGGSVSATNLGDPITLAFVLPTVTQTTELRDTLLISYQLNGQGSVRTVSATITVNPDSTIPTPPTIQNITATGTGGTSISHTLQVSNVPSGYSFLSAAPASNLSDDNVTASGTDSSGTVTISFGLPSVGSSTEITGNLDVQYIDGTDTLDVAVPVTLTVNPPDPPTVTNITATGIENTTISETITVTNVPAGYSFLSATPDSTLSTANVTASGTESNGTISVDIGLPSAQATAITGNIIVSYGDGTNTLISNSAVSLTVNAAVVDPPTIQDIAVTGTGGTSETHILQVTDIPDGYTFDSATPDSDLTDESVTASGAESGGTVTITFGLPEVRTTTTITGNLDVTYTDGTDDLDVVVPVTLTVNPVPSPAFQNITVNGTGGTTVNANLGVTPTDFTITSVFGNRESTFTTAGGSVSATNLSNPITLAFVLPTVNATTTLTDTLQISYQLNGVGFAPTVTATITVNPDSTIPTPPTIQNITVTGTGGTSETHTLQVSNVPDGYSFVSATPASNLSDDNVTASGTDSSGTVTISFGLPSVGSSTTITGDLSVRYSNGTTNLDVTVPVTLTVNPPDPPTVTNITATGTENTTISETITVTNVPAGYSFTNATADATLTSAGVTISGTESGGTISVDIGLPSAQASTITGNILVSYGDGSTTLTSNSAVSLTVNPPDPPTVTNITATGTENTTITDTITVTNIPAGYTFTSVSRDSALTSASVTISGTESNGTISVDIGLPSAQATPITGNIVVTYGDGTNTLTSNSAVSLTVEPVIIDPPIISDITATGTGGTSISHTLQVSNIPAGYTFDSAAPDSDLTDESVTASGTESSGTVTISFGLPSVGTSTTITGNLDVTYTDGTDDLDVTVPVTLTVNPVPSPVFQNITLNGTSGATVNANIPVTPTDFTVTSVSGSSQTTFTLAGGSVSATNLGDPITLAFVLPTVTQTTELRDTLLISYQLNGQGSVRTVSATITVNPDSTIPTPPTIQNITATGTGGTSISHTLQVSNVPSGYSFLSAAPASNLSDDNVTASGTDSSGTVTISFGLPPVSATATITGDLSVRYSDGTTPIDVTVPVSLTVNPPTPPTVTNITVTGTENTTITQTITVTNVPSGYTFTSIAADSALTNAGVTISGTESNGTISVDIGLPSAQATAITGNIIVSYGGLTSNSTVSLTVNAAPTTPPTPRTNPIGATVDETLYPLAEGVVITEITATVGTDEFNDDVLAIPLEHLFGEVIDVSLSVPNNPVLSGFTTDGQRGSGIGSESSVDFLVILHEPDGEFTVTARLGDGTSQTITVKIQEEANATPSATVTRATLNGVAINPDPPTIQSITLTGTGGASVSHALSVSDVPSGYSFTSAAPDSTLSTAGVTASGAESGGTVTITFGLPTVSSSTEITGNLNVRYTGGTSNLDVVVPVDITVNPPTPPTVTNITATGIENTTITQTITVTNVPSGYTFTSVTRDSALTNAGVTISGTESNGTISVSIGLPSAQTSPITGNIIVSYGGLTSNSAVSLTVNAAPTTPPTTPPSTVTPPTIQNITVTGTGGTSISHTLQVSNVPSGYSFLSVTPNSPIINVSGTESGGTVTLSFVLPTVNNSHTLTGNLNIRYSNGTDNLDVIVPVSVTINLPAPPTVTDITATGTENTTITETITVSNVPAGYTYTSIAADSTLTAAGVSISGTESRGEITVRIDLPSAQATPITGNIIVSYGDGSTTLTSDSAVSLTVETVDPPTISDITATGTGGTPISHILQVSDIPSGYNFVSAAPASNLSDDNVTASGTDSGGTVTISFGLPEVRTSTTITGNLDVRYSDGTDNLDVAVPVTLTVNPVPLPVFQDIAVTGTSGSTVNANIPVTPSDFTVTSVSGTRSSTFTQAGGTVSTTSLSNPITLAFVLPTVTQTTELTETLNISYRLNGAGFGPTVTATITVNPVTPDLPTIQDITATGTGGTSIPYNLQVSGVPSGYNFVSAAPDSTLSTASVTASGAESNGAVTVTFGLPTVNSSTEITGNLNVRYSDGTTNLDVTVPVSLTVNPPAPPTVTDITATGIVDTTITETITVTNVPVGYAYTSIAADSALTAAGVSISGIESNGTITVSIDLPSTQASITGNIIVTYGDGTNTLTSNSAVSLTVNPVPTVPPTTPPTVPPTTPPTTPPTVPPTTPPTIQDITVTGTSGTSISHNLQVSNIPSDYSFVSIQPATNFEDVTIAGTESNGVIIITFDLPDVDEFTIITGDLLVRYLDGMEDSQQFTVPVTIQINPERSGGSSDDHKKAPTFGVSLETDTQLVTGGFSFNGIVLDITDNWHTDFNRTSSIIGDTNIVTIKGHAPDGFRQVILSLGVPEVGMVNNADTAIILNLERNNETGLEISEILYSQSEEGLVDETRTTATVQKASCSLLDNNQQCYEFTIEFTVMAPLLDDVLTISAMDEKRRITHTYINDGVEFAGESLLEASTDRFIQKVASQDPGSFIELTQQDRRYNVWEDQDGYLWERNSADTWMRLTYPGLDLMPDDPSMSIKTRLHSDFARIIQMEQDRATLVFDSALIQNEMDDSSNYNLPAYMPEHLDPVLLENMELEEILELEKMLNRHIYEDSWD